MPDFVCVACNLVFPSCTSKPKFGRDNRSVAESMLEGLRNFYKEVKIYSCEFACKHHSSCWDAAQRAIFGERAQWEQRKRAVKTEREKEALVRHGSLPRQTPLMWEGTMRKTSHVAACCFSHSTLEVRIVLPISRNCRPNVLASGPGWMTNVDGRLKRCESASSTN